jgi:uncharacterized protein
MFRETTKLIGVLVLLVVSVWPAAAQLSREERALLTEARKGRVERVQELIDEGVNVNVRDSEGNSALIQALDRRRAEVAELLLTHDAEVCETALHRAAVRSEPDLFEKVLSQASNAPEIGDVALVHAAFLGRTENVTLLLDAGVPVDSVHRTNGRTAIMQAIDQGRVETVELLIARGADLNARDPGGLSVLGHAMRSEELYGERQKTVLDRLQEAGARQ